MLAHILALTVGLLSFALYMSAFFFPEVYRKSDLTWSGIGLFYALVLWVCAGRITGGVLLGQTASVALLGWLGWQTINLRRELAPIALRTPLPNEAKTIAQATQFKLGELKSRWQQTKLAEQTNRLAGTIAGWTSSITQSKKQPPPVGNRSRKSKKSAPQPSIAPAATAEPVASESIVAEPLIAEAIDESAIGESAIGESAIGESAVEPSVTPARPARSPGLFGGLRRNAPKAKAPKAKSPEVKAPRPTPPPEPSPDLEEFENWEDEETIEPVPTPEATIEAVVVIESEEGTIEDVVVIVESEETPIEAVVVETENPSPDELVAVEVIEESAPPVEDAIEAAIVSTDLTSADSASVEADNLPDSSPDSSSEGDEWIDPKPPAPTQAD